MDEKDFKEILEILKELDKEDPGNPVSSDELKDILNVEYKQLLADIKYLEGEGYIILKQFYGDDFEVNITPQGISKLKELNVEEKKE